MLLDIHLGDNQIAEPETCFMIIELQKNLSKIEIQNIKITI